MKSTVSFYTYETIILEVQKRELSASQIIFTFLRARVIQGWPKGYGKYQEPRQVCTKMSEVHNCF